MRRKTEKTACGPERLCFDGSARNRYGKLLEEWYGEDASAAIAGHLPKPVSLADTLAELTEKLIPEWMRGMTLIREHWAEIVGPAGVKRADPVRLEGKELLLEVHHPMYRMAFDTPRMKAELVRKINEVTGCEFCTGVKFSAGGMFAGERKGERKKEKK